jgi:spermidine synthase
MRRSSDLPGGGGAVGGVRLALALFAMAFGYALLSICLFRMLAFTLSSTAFFVLYACAAMPLGAYLSERRPADGPARLTMPLAALCAVAVLLPFIGWLATRGQPLMSLPDASAGRYIDLWAFFGRLLQQLLTVSPVFIAWGFAEFVGYRAAIESRSRGLQRGFYLIFVWAMACALAAGYVLVPAWGLVRTIAVVPLSALIAFDLTTTRETARLRRVGPYLAAALAIAAIGPLDGPLARLLLIDMRYNVGDLLHNHRMPVGDEQGNTAMLAGEWGKYTHFSLVSYERGGTTQVFGAYDGIVYWMANPQRKYGFSPLTAAVFDALPANADVAVLGAGGGFQVSDALAKSPHSVVAVDLVPEVFAYLKGPFAWANGRVYESPIVETHVADGRSYLQTTDRAFDAILLPHTDSALANTKTLFEVGSRLHSVEAFRLMRSRLKPNGIVAAMKAIDVDGLLFNRYAASFREAGFHVVGWTLPSKGLQWFVLIASSSREALKRPASSYDYFAKNGYRFVDFDETAPSAEPLYDDSPWALGILGTMVPPAQLRQILWTIAAIALAGVVGVTGLSLRRRTADETVGARLRFALAGVAVGAHAAFLQNAVIFWLLVNLVNPLAAFFIGTALFLLAWGVSSMMIGRWYILLAIGAAGLVGLFAAGTWHGSVMIASLGCVALGSGLCFPLLGLTFQSRLLNLFIADAIGGFAAGVLGILLPVLLGFDSFFAVLPWVSLATMVLVALVVGHDRALLRDPALAEAAS